MTRLLWSLGFIGFLLSSQALASQPFEVSRRSAKKLLKNNVLFSTSLFDVTRKSTALDASFKNMFWVNLEAVSVTEAKLATRGEVLHYKTGNFAIVRIPEEDDVAYLSGLLHVRGASCGALVALHGDTLLPKAAAPSPVVSIDQTLAVVKTLGDEVVSDNIRATVAELSAIHTRYYKSPTGKQVPTLLMSMYQQHVQARDDVTIRTFRHGSGLPQDSVIIRIEGQTRPDEVVILGSHIDSITGWGGSGRSPGADDNASGTATNLEIFRILMDKGIRLQRTLEIHGYAAEEIGLRGSQEIAAFYRSNSVNVIAMVQHDMNLYTGDEPEKIWFVENQTNPALTQSLATLGQRYLTVPIGFKKLNGGSSDHYSWTRKGYASAFPFEDPGAYNPNIHTTGDTIENSGNFKQATAFARLALGYIAHFAGTAE